MRGLGGSSHHPLTRKELLVHRASGDSHGGGYFIYANHHIKEAHHLRFFSTRLSQTDCPWMRRNTASYDKVLVKFWDLDPGEGVVYRHIVLALALSFGTDLLR